MRKKYTQSNNNFYKKSKNLLELAMSMQDNEDGVSIQDIMESLNVSKRTAIRIKDSIKSWFPQTKEIRGSHNSKKYTLPSGTISIRTVTDNSPTKDNFQTKLEALFDLAKKSGYNKLTDKQVMIAYYGKYTTKDNNDRKTLSEIKEGLNKLKSPYKELIDHNK